MDRECPSTFESAPKRERQTFSPSNATDALAVTSSGENIRPMSGRAPAKDAKVERTRAERIVSVDCPARSTVTLVVRYGSTASKLRFASTHARVAPAFGAVV